MTSTHPTRTDAPSIEAPSTEAPSIERGDPEPSADEALDGADTALAIRFRLLRPGARRPDRQSELASGFDLRACTEEPITVGPTPVLVPTGVAIAAPPGSDVQIRPRSGLSRRGVMATFGTIDADYRGELFVTMYALPGVDPLTVTTGDRIAQLVIARLAPVRWVAVDALDETERGGGGHGSTGLR